MADTDVKKKCNVPDCGKPSGQSRGLCAAHYWYLKKGRDAARRAEIARYAAAPSNRGGRRRAKRTQPVEAPPAPKGPDAPGRLADRSAVASADSVGDNGDERTTADEVISTCCEVCTVLGMERIKWQGGFIFVNPETGAAAELTEPGLVYKNEFRRVPS